MDRGYDTRSPIQKTSSLPRTFALFRAYMIVVCVLLFSGVFFTLAYAPLFKVRTIEVSGSTMSPNENIQIYASKVLEGNWRTVVPFSTAIGVPARTLEKSISQAFPSVEQAVIERVGISGIRISVIEKAPLFAYCKNNTCALGDAKGIVFTFSDRGAYETVDGSPAQFIRRGSSTTDDVVALGTELLPKANRIALDKTRAFLAAHGFVIKKIHLEPLGFFNVLSVSAVTGIETEFRFRDNQKIDQQLQDLGLAFEKGLRQKIDGREVGYVISYVPQKVIYKNTGAQN